MDCSINYDTKTILSIYERLTQKNQLNVVILKYSFPFYFLVKIIKEENVKLNWIYIILNELFINKLFFT